MRCGDAADVINSLITHDPEKRPTADALLKGKLSLGIEEGVLEETLRGVNPGMKMYQYILNKVFYVDPTAEYAPFNQKSYDDKSSELREIVIETVERIFRLHGAKKIETPLFERSTATESPITVNNNCTI